MKRKNCFRFGLVALLTCVGLLVLRLPQIHAENHLEETRLSSSAAENFTIQKMKEIWADKTRAGFDAYFQDYPDDKRVLADESGGLFSYWGADPSRETVVEKSIVHYADGSTKERDLEGPDATTVGAIREVLYPLLKN